MPAIPADLQALLDRVAEGAARSCGADDAMVRVLEGDVLRRVAHCGTIATLPEGDLIPLAEASEAVRERRTIQNADVSALANLSRVWALAARELGIRTEMQTPLLIGDR